MYVLQKTGILASLLAACALLVGSALTAEPRSTPKAGPNESITLPINATGILSQCGDYFTFNPDEDKYGVVPEEYDKNYIPVPDMIVPVYGFMADKTFDVEAAMKLPQGENPYLLSDINRALWEGHTFIWTYNELSADAHQYAKDYADKWNETHDKKVIVLTWKGKQGLPQDSKPRPQTSESLPQDREFAFSSWNISQSCETFSDDTFEEFMEKSNEHNAERDIETLPVAKLVDGELPR